MTTDWIRAAETRDRENRDKVTREISVFLTKCANMLSSRANLSDRRAGHRDRAVRA